MHDNFSNQADLYAQYRPRYPAAMYDFIFQHIDQKHTAWDCATGSGQIAVYLADHFTEVYATDISSEQMKHAPKKENIRYLNAPAEQSGLPASMFDLITVGQAVHWFDFDRFFDEVNRTAKVGALIAVTGYGMVRVDENLNPVINTFYERAFEEYFMENRRYLDERYQTIPFPFKEIETPEFSISYRWKLKNLEGYFNSWSAVQKIKDEEGFNPADEVMEKVRREWGKDEIKEVTFPVFLRLGRVKK